MSPLPRLPGYGGLDLRALNDYARQMGEMTKAQQDKLQAAADKLRGTPAQIDLSPLMALADSWNKTNLAQGYQRPMSKAELERQAMAIEQGAADVGMQGLKGQMDVAKTKLDLQAHAQDMAMKQAMNEQELAIRQQEANIKAMGAKAGGIPSADQFKAGGFAKRMMMSEAVVDNLMKNTGYDPTTFGQSLASATPKLLGGNKALGVQGQQFDQAKRNFVSAVLRRESGAAISDSEFKNEDIKYFPQYGDSPEVIEQKRQARGQAIASMAAEAGNAMNAIPSVAIGTAPTVDVNTGKPWEKYGSKK